MRSINSQKIIKTLLFFIIFSSHMAFSHVNNSLVFYIHGDNSYSYLKNDKRKHADKEAYKQAKTIAKSCKNCEVFIFRELQKNIFFSAKAEYYREASLVMKMNYHRQRGEEDIRFYREFTLKMQDKKNKIKSFFIYLGHHIPIDSVKGYSSSLPHLEFSLQDLTQKLLKLRVGLSLDFKFDGLILSTCKNGNPQTVRALSPFSKFIIASPESLHLSYFDFSDFFYLKDDFSTKRLMKNLAKKSFDTLSAEFKTVVSVALYETSLTRNFVESFALKKSFRQKYEKERGVTIYYKAALFGRHKKRKVHSGWGEQ